MDKLKSLKTNTSGKEDIKAHYIITFKKIEGLPRNWGNPLHLSWKRGNKKENSGEIKSVPKEGIAEFNHVITLDSTITKTAKGYQSKTINLTLKEEIKALGPGKKPITLGACEINLAQYIESRTEKSNLFPIKDKSKQICNLYVTIQSNWLKINGKSMVKVEGGENQKEVLQELGKQQIHKDGNDYYLQTEQDMSEPDQTDLGGDGHDSDDEEDISFEDDNHSSISTNSNTTTTTTSSTVGKSDPPSLKRHSSNLSSASEGTASASTSQVNLGELFKSPSTTTPVKDSKPEKEKDSASINANTMESKFKKYKRKLKSYKAELEKNRAEKEEVKKMVDEMEKIKERTKTVGDGVLHDYIMQIDNLTKENGDLKVEIQKEKNQSTRDSNEIINLQNQVISLGSQLDTVNQENSTLSENIKILEDKITLHEQSGGDQSVQLELQQELNQSLSVIENLNLELTQTKNQLSNAQEENRTQFIQLEQERLKSNSNESNANRMVQENNNLKQQIEHSDKTIHLQIDEFEKEKLLLQNEINQLKSQASSSGDNQKELENLKITIKEKIEIIDNNNEINEANNLEIEKLKELTATLEQEITNLNDLNNTKDQEIESLRQSNDQSALVKDLQDQLSQKETELSEKQFQLDQLTPLEGKVEKLKEKLSQKKKKIQERDQEIEELKEKQSESTGTEVSVDTSQLDEKKKEIEELELKLQEKQQDLESAESMVANRDEELKTLQSNMDKEIMVLKSNIELQEKEIELLKSSNNNSIENFKDEKDEEILELKMKFENEKLDLQNEISHMQIVQEENNQLKSQIREYQTDSTYKQNLVNEYQSMIDKLQLEIDESNSRNQDLIIKLQEAKDHHSDKDEKEKEDKDSDSENEKDEKIQQLKDKVKKLKAKLDDKDDEWIEEKIKFEDTIQELQTQNQHLESSNQELQLNLNDLKSNVSIVPVVIDNEKEINEIKFKLEQEVIKSQNLQEQLSVQKEREKELMSQVSSPSSSSSPKLISNGIGEDIKKELDENKNIEASIYWPEIDYDRNSIPYCGSSVWALIDSIGGISKPDNQRLLSKVIISLEKSFLRSGNDCKFICYWLATVAHILHKIHQVGLIQEQADPIVSGVEISMSSFSSPSVELGGSFVRDLQALLLNIYSKLISICEIKIEKILIQSIFIQDSLILKSSPMSTTSSPMSKMTGSATASPKPNSSNSKSILNLLSILDGIILFIRESKISNVIGNQLLNQIFYFINSQITNHLLTNQSVCTSTQGLEVKMGVSRLKEWCSTTNFKTASQQLDPAHEASNLLVIDKNVFVDVEAIKSIFSKLNLNQIRKLLESFAPDDLSPEPLPQTLKKAMDNNWRQPFDINSLPLLIDSSKKLKL
ncbi:C2 calcium/lipid-binding region-containing protein [Tieghemostelium lacteum]|uniref:C2 calcium/lipid-binding region-containing protein n=1 Tax=Tieghemostelium lacteum TaxID=361077 RepID=A0A152A3I2_TIELA|nr:C2 calcium/lipid-binding region-containing protein [Tieghemostelium lacteum]|eukprot:KYR00657.1 C2 calcium/lipid-binding region-containing protein [Tieghemostelium lacteum]